MSSQHVDQSAAEKPDTAPRTGSALPLVALCLGFFMIMMDATVVNTALPVIGHDLSATVSGLQWVTAGYTLVFACLLLSAGSLGDRLGSRRVFLAGLVVFTVASGVCGLAPNLPVLVAARIVQGAGAALALPTSLALINASYPDREQRARAIGVWGGLGGVAAGLGPVLGGVLTNWVGWPAIFYINLPIGVAALVLTLRYVAAPSAKSGTKPDLPGQVLSVVAVAALAFGLIQAQPLGWTAPAILVAFGVAVVAGAAFVLTEHRHSSPMLPLKLFKEREFSGSIAIGAAINIGFYGELFLLALYFQDVRHFSPLLTGLAMLPQPGIASLASSLGGRHTARIGARPVMLIGLVVGALGLLSLVLAGEHTPYWMLIVPLLAVGFGTAYTMPAATAATMEAAPAKQAGTASGALNASRQIGSTLGVAIFGTVTAGSAAFMTGYHVSVGIGAAVFAAGALVAWIAVPRPKPA
ncbi:DHA2 family methylenomycin A resistance protein-like MFS transporter [Amycolatopsis bartoniae]|uniref:MFS transporter n=1 Tax=Amycolatopsis bartoniae TaxID=941986 RepID=A0A8H9IWF3_9PSEU|nr:MFS transporter [Amycolatopsis bartoniae]MBB2937919.1 DHA2 family methylenomycin A resistance protein-like MFS transporter [Amycolatopsis bartoniae]TVT08584.1 MFS transporter [Amycolatopsis bartoniae]GHF41695.1 MFS transporter [Amycolatopsis bartoniae]